MSTGSSAAWRAAFSRAAAAAVRWACSTAARSAAVSRGMLNTGNIQKSRGNSGVMKLLESATMKRLCSQTSSASKG
uniref:Uncharacterized protein n=2 Tax=Human herpesvirus 2 TaxID=10310 RepID=A0A481TWZ6_HHV2|nr:hypothetical protein [Human alphaherpesvirus 2]QBH85297.1 hypothetical protein [Human alphaherpesvirus 2]